MLAFGFSSGLPFALLIGTLNAWLGDAKINLATIGVLSWIGLGYAFKFLWSPLVDRVNLPLLGDLGRRKSWILLCQAVTDRFLCRAGRRRSGDQHRQFRDLRGHRRLLVRDPGHRCRRLAHRCRRRAHAGGVALRSLPVRLPHRFDRRRRLRACSCGPDAVGKRLSRHGGAGRALMVVAVHRARHAAPPANVIEEGLEQPGESARRSGLARSRSSVSAGCGRSFRSAGS